MTRYTMPARSQGDAFMQRTMARFDEKDVHSLAPEVESAVRKWLYQRLNNTSLSTSSMAPGDEALIKATGLNPHMSVYGWPFCLDELDGVDVEGGAA